MSTTPTDSLANEAAPDHGALVLPATEETSELDVRFGYRIGSCTFVIDRNLLTEFVVRPVIYRVPRSPSWLTGVINLRGNIVSVLDLASTLGTVSVGNPGEYVLVVDKGQEALGVMLDAAPRSLTNPQAQTRSLPVPNACAEYFLPGVLADSTTWYQLDIKQLALNLASDA